jgi:hypothetical protein
LLAQRPGSALYQSLNALSGGDVRAWQAIRAVYVVLGGATVAVTFSLLLQLARSMWIAVLGALALWVSYGFWHFQSDPDVYSPVVLSAALLLLVYARYVTAPTTRRAALLGLCGALALLTHQLNVELAGLIGLSLVVLAYHYRHSDPGRFAWRHVALYAALCAVLLVGAYLAAWQSASTYLVEIGVPKPGFVTWALRYFVSAGQGQATWGNNALNLGTLPTAGYTFLSSWVLLPLWNTITLWQAALLGLLLAGGIGLLLHVPFVLRRAQMPYRLVALVCGLALAANFVSGWWWANGNIKFYLMMQLDLLVLVALYARYVDGLWERRISRALLGAAALGLVAFHLLVTLPYERQGGVFTVTDLIGAKRVSVWVSRLDYHTLFDHISTQSSHYLQPGFCDNPPPDDSAEVWWVVNVRETADCPSLANAAQIGQFQADRTRDTYLILRVK